MTAISMKINRLDTHDRLKHFVNQDFDIGNNCQEIIDKRPFGSHPFYIFVHKRSIDPQERVALYMKGYYPSIGETPNARIIWQPRLTKPEMQTNSMLFKGYPGKDTVKVIWILPAEELWKSFEEGQMTGSEDIRGSIANYRYNKKKTEAKEDDDLSEEAIRVIYKQIAKVKPSIWAPS